MTHDVIVTLTFAGVPSETTKEAMRKVRDELPLTLLEMARVRLGATRVSARVMGLPPNEAFLDLVLSGD